MDLRRTLCMCITGLQFRHLTMRLEKIWTNELLYLCTVCMYVCMYSMSEFTIFKS